MKEAKEKKAFQVNGFFIFLFTLAILGLDILSVVKSGHDPSFFQVLLFIICGLLFSGLYIVQPNEAKVITFFGRYVGSTTDDGFWWTNPFTKRKSISLRMRNFESSMLKVNDANGNPIEIASVVVWKVVDSASATFNVENYQEYVTIQSETAVRTLANHYPYDNHDVGKISLRGNPDEITETLRKELDLRLKYAGVNVVEARLSHLAYAPEIAQAMLRRQQAEAIIAARQKIVEGAVGMVQMALTQLSEQKIVELDSERKAAMVNNLLVTLVSENETKPVINTGSIY